MKTVKKYINKQIITIVSDLIDKREEIDIVINFDTYEDDFYVDLSRDNQELSFAFVDDTLRIVVYHSCHCKITFEIREMDEILNLNYALDMLLESFLFNEWYNLVADLANHTLWQMVEKYKKYKVNDI
ncbi:hypothetical protein QM879_00445 [Streptococcus salivarius]|uniref:hypothetical protein n=1 Tax=Streptococcus salivarius TaxID=1304 RepID=UPI0039C0D1E7